MPKEVEEETGPGVLDDLKLTAKQKDFAEQYVHCMNATKAAWRTGLSVKAAGVTGHHWLKNPKVQEAIKRVRAQRAQKLEGLKERVLEELACIAVADLTDVIFIKDGEIHVKDLAKLPSEVTRCIRTISMVPTKYGTSCRVEFYDKEKALELLGKHAGMWWDKEEDADEKSRAGRNEKAIVDRLRAAVTRVRGGKGND